MATEQEKQHEIEGKILTILVQNPDMLHPARRVLHKDYFTNESYRTIYEQMVEHLQENSGALISSEVLTLRLKKIKLDRPDFFDGPLNIILREDLPEGEKNNLPFYTGEIKKSWVDRGLRRVIESSANLIKIGDTYGAEKVLYTDRPVPLDQMFEGDVNKDLSPHLDELEFDRRNAHIYGGIPLGLKPLDDATGGHARKVLIVVVGGTGVGKSLILGQVAINVARQGRKVLLVTVENNKKSYMNRLYSNISGVSFSAFKRGMFSEYERNKIYGNMSSMPEDFFLQVVEFPDGCSTQDIRFYLSKMRDELDYLVVDQISNMNPNDSEKFKPGSWQGYDRIGLELKRFADSAYNGKGLRILTAMQASGGVSEKKDLNSDDIAGAKRILHHAHAGLYITRDGDAYTMGASKYRDAKVDPFPIFPNFNCWQISTTPAGEGGTAVAGNYSVPTPQVLPPREARQSVQPVVVVESLAPSIPTPIPPKTETKKDDQKGIRQVSEDEAF